MNCAWQAYIDLFPLWTRSQIDFYRNDLLETRLRLGEAPELRTRKGSLFLSRKVLPDDLRFVINMGSKYSPWAAESISSGYITTQGGHRIGVCGVVAIHDGKINGIRTPTSLCVRVAREFPGIAKPLSNMKGSLLIIGSPGCGKTTLLRDLVRQISQTRDCAVAVVDERGELFPNLEGRMLFTPGVRTDVMNGCGKSEGIDMVLRSMTPMFIAVDEITRKEDCDALIRAAWCGVHLLATAHAGSIDDLKRRPIYQRLLESKVFQNIVVLKPDKTWTMEELHL